MDEWLVWTDGGARGNPGPAASGVVIRKGGETVWEEGYWLGEMTNNQAEYLALLRGLVKVHELGASRVTVHMDSQLVVEQVSGRYKVKDAGLRERWQEVQEILKGFSAVEMRYVPRAENARADALVNKALDERLA